MIFDFKSNWTGVRCHQKGPKKFGPTLFGPKPVDRWGSEVLGPIFTFLDMQDGWLAKSTHNYRTFMNLKT